MTCKECEEVLLDSENCAGRKSWVASVSLMNVVRRHAESCSECAAKMSQISRMDAALDQLRRSTIGIEVPASIESSLLGEFRRRSTSRAIYLPSTFRWRLVLAVAAALVVVAGLVFYGSLRARTSMAAQAARTEHSVEQPPSEPRSGAGSEQGLIDKQHPSADRPGLVSVNTGRATKLDRRSQKQATREPVSSVENELSLNGGGNVVRVTLPVASLVAMGVPMNPELSDRRVTADVARDPFGAVIAIRLVEAGPSAN
jgi:hypothetical protein